MKKLTVFTAMGFLGVLMWSTVSEADIERCVSVGNQLMRQQTSGASDLVTSSVDSVKPCMKAICTKLSDIGRLEEFVRAGEEHVAERTARSGSVDPLGWNRACVQSGKNRLDVKECLMLRRLNESVCYKVVLWAIS